MIFEYTEATQKKLYEIDDKYTAILDDLTKQILDLNATEEKGKDKDRQLAQLIEERDRAEGQRLHYFTVILDEAEKEYFDTFGGDPAALLEEGKRQTPLIAENYLNFDLITANGQPATADNKNLIPRHEKKNISTFFARTVIETGLQLIIDFLADYPDQANELNAFISEYISNNPHFEATGGEELTPAEAKNKLTYIQGIAKNTLLPTDKINGNVWALLKNTNGQFVFNTSRDGDDRKINVLLSLNFEEIEGVKISKKLTRYDRRVYCAIGALCENGDIKHRGRIETNYKQIYRQMNGGGNANAKDAEKIKNSLLKMTAAVITLSNKNEIDNGYNYPPFNYYGNLLKLDAIDQGDRSRVIIHSYPVLLDFAKGRKQITTVDTKLLHSPLSKTEDNIAIEDYFLQELSRIKRGERNNKMLYKTIFEETHTANTTTDRKKEARAREKITRLLTFYKGENFIADFKESKKDGKPDGITIIIK